MNIYLFGFMGTGKSAVGRKIAKKLNLDFIDMDQLIEAREGSKISDIFKEKGEPYFRDLEAQLVKELVLKSNVVVATGGGVVKNRDNVELFIKHGYCICLTASQETIYKRVSKARHRPLLVQGDLTKRINELLLERKPLYDQIPRQLDTTYLSIYEAAKKIIHLAN